MLRLSFFRIGYRGFCATLGLVGTALIAGAVVAGPNNLQQAAVFDAAARASSAAASSCFLGKIAHPAAHAIERSTVFIALVGPDGTLLSEGTGFVTATNAAHRASGPRIVTAAHVVGPREPMPEDARLMVFFSDGTPLGVPRILTSGPTHTVSVGGFDVIADDIAVLEIARFVDAKAGERFAALTGLPVERSETLRIGEASNPTGAVWGFSGAAAIDRDGRVVGVLTGADFRGRVTVELGSIQESNATGHAVARPVTLPSQSLVVVEPINASNILRELGIAETGSAHATKTDIILAGFPLANCASTSATIDTADSPSGAALLLKWRNIGQTGAWLLPPHFGTNKLKLDRS